jgi:hypothetical protein
MNQNTMPHRGHRRTTLGSVVTMTIAVFATIGLAACTGGSDGDGRTPELGVVAAAALPASPLETDGAVDVCALITPDELSATFGQTFDAGAPTHHDGMGGDQCIWNVADPMSVGMVSLTVQRNADLPDELHDNGMDAERLFDETRRTMYADGVDLALGEKSYTSGSTVHVFYDDAIFDFMALGDTPEDIAAIQALATSTIETLMA